MLGIQLRRLARNAVAVPGFRHGLRWFLNQPHVPASWRDLAHRKIAKRARFPHGAEFSYRTPSGSELRFAHGGTTNYLYWLHEYEPETTSLFASLARRANLILDIGSADGLYSVLGAEANPSAKIIAFEPGLDAAAACKRNVELNLPLTRNVEIHQLALGRVDSTATLFVAGETGGTSSLNPEFRSDRVEQSVTVRSGDEFLKENGIERVDLIKIDTESTEPDVLQGLAGQLRSHHPEVICEVLYGRTEQALDTLMRSFGYSCYWISDRGLVRRDAIEGDPTYRHPNHLFTTRSLTELDLE